MPQQNRRIEPSIALLSRPVRQGALRSSSRLWDNRYQVPSAVLIAGSSSGGQTVGLGVVVIRSTLRCPLLSQPAEEEATFTRRRLVNLGPRSSMVMANAQCESARNATAPLGDGPRHRVVGRHCYLYPPMIPGPADG